MPSLEERIRARAHRLWEEEGRPQGRGDTHWEKARILVAIEDDRTSLVPVQPDAPEEAAIQENLGEFPGFESDEGDRQQFPSRRMTARASPSEQRTETTARWPAEERPKMSSARRDRLERLKAVCHELANEIGPRNIYQYAALGRAAQFIERQFEACGYAPGRQEFEAKGKTFANIVAERTGRSAPNEIFLIGAHYDTHKNSPGANDNASAVAALLELSRVASHWEPERTLRFVAFTNEEKPFTRTADMGSRVYARACRERGDNIVGMLCLETIGCCSDRPGSQRLSVGGHLFPPRGDFLAFIGNTSSGTLLRRISSAFRTGTTVEARALTLPSFLPGARSSDHWSFWREGFQAVMATDTGPLRYRHYHKASDTPDKIGFAFLERIVGGLEAVQRGMAYR